MIPCCGTLLFHNKTPTNRGDKVKELCLMVPWMETLPFLQGGPKVTSHKEGVK